MTRTPGVVLTHLRRALGLGWREAAERVGLSPTDYAALEVGAAHLESTAAWDDLCHRLRGTSRPDHAPRYDEVYLEGLAELEAG